MTARRRITAALIGLVAMVLVGWLVSEQAGGNGPNPGAPGAESGMPVRALSDLPAEAASTLRLVRQGGPYPHPQADGGVFQNREKRLPGKETGYYREYTVSTPGSRDRGPRRLITGAGGELYYTEDHYRSFVVVDPDR